MKILRDVAGSAVKHFVYFMVKFVSIREHSWFLMNSLRLGENGLKRKCRDGQIIGSFKWRLDGGRDGFVSNIDQTICGKDLDSGRVEIERRIEWFVWNPVIDAIVDGQLGGGGIDCE